MINDELLNKFDRIEDLLVSEEILGTFLEGNLRGSEFREVQNYIHADAVVSDLIDIIEDDINGANDLDLSYELGIESMIGSDDIYANIVLPEISSFEMNSLIDSSSSLTDDIILGCDCHKFVNDKGHFLHSDNHDNNHHHDPGLDFGMMDNIE